MLNVASLADAWIEMFMYAHLLRKLVVASLADAWIEILQ